MADTRGVPLKTDFDKQVEFCLPQARTSFLRPLHPAQLTQEKRDFCTVARGVQTPSQNISLLPVTSGLRHLIFSLLYSMWT